MITLLHDRIDIRWELDLPTRKRIANRLAKEVASNYPIHKLNEVVNESLHQWTRKEFGKREKARLMQTVAADPVAWIRACLRIIIGHKLAEYGNPVSISFQRTLRIPDDGGIYPIPDRLGQFPIRKIPDLSESLSEPRRTFGGFAIPMHQVEAVVVEFDCFFSPPAAVKVGTGLVNAINGEPWADGLPAVPQGYIVVPDQAWLDGYSVEPGIIRQFVAIGLGEGATAEEQLSATRCGGLQFEVFPMKLDVYLDKVVRPEIPETLEGLVNAAIWDILQQNGMRRCRERAMPDGGSPMGMAAGGAMEQEVYQDSYGPDAWDLDRPAKIWVHLCDATYWQDLTGERAPGRPPSVTEHDVCGYRWFEYGDPEKQVLQRTEHLRALKSIAEFSELQGAAGESLDTSVEVKRVSDLAAERKWRHMER
jgi:hypothetical protein